MATYANSGGIFNNHFNANLAGNLAVNNLADRFRVERITAMSLWRRLFGAPLLSSHAAAIV